MIAPATGEAVETGAGVKTEKTKHRQNDEKTEKTKYRQKDEEAGC